MQLEGKVAIVTGGAAGFGQGIARRFAREGAKVVVADLNEVEARATVETIIDAGGSGLAVRCDVGSGDDFKSLVERTLDEWGQLDIVVNNAGTTHRNGPMLSVDEATFDRVYQVNVKSIFNSAHATLPAFRKAGSGVFINIASTAGVRPRPGLAWYNGSKGAVIAITKSMAIELGPENIRVNAVNPVMGDTALLDDFIGGDAPEKRAKVLAGIPLGRLSTPEDIAGACVYLAGPDAGFLTGVCMEVDGGRCI